MSHKTIVGLKKPRNSAAACSHRQSTAQNPFYCTFRCTTALHCTVQSIPGAIQRVLCEIGVILCCRGLIIYIMVISQHVIFDRGKSSLLFRALASCFEFPFSSRIFFTIRDHRRTCNLNTMNLAYTRLLVLMQMVRGCAVREREAKFILFRLLVRDHYCLQGAFSLVQWHHIVFLSVTIQQSSNCWSQFLIRFAYLILSKPNCPQALSIFRGGWVHLDIPHRSRKTEHFKSIAWIDAVLNLFFRAPNVWLGYWFSVDEVNYFHCFIIIKE